MEDHADESNYQDRLFAFINDNELAAIGQRFQPYFELHKIEHIFDLFDVVQSASSDINTAKLIWKTQRDLPIELKKAVIAVYSRHFQNLVYLYILADWPYNYKHTQSYHRLNNRSC